jgi:hypothetical protein
MKKLALLMSLIAFSAQAEVVITGGFGTDGASGESIPTKNSVKDASAIYKALNVKAGNDAKETKIIQISDESSLECERPTLGISRLSAGCSISLRASQKAVLVRGAGLSAKLTFTGKLATKIFNALPADNSGRVGASTKEVANLSCTKVVRPGLEATCTIKNTNAIALDVEL